MMAAEREVTGIRGASPSGRHGFTIIEVIISMVILTVGVLAMASTTAYVVRQTTFADLLTERAAAFQTVVDKLQALPYDDVTSGSDTIGIFRADWTAVAQGAQIKEVTIVTYGPGLDPSASMPMMSPQAPDTFVFKILRGR